MKLGFVLPALFIGAVVDLQAAELSLSVQGRALRGPAPAARSVSQVVPAAKPAAPDRTANEALRDVPGVFSQERAPFGLGIGPGSAGTLSIRGSAVSQRALLLMDGRPNMAGLFGHPLNDSYGTEWVDRLEVVRGPDSVRYGSGALAGSVNLVPKRLGAPGRSASLSVSGGSYGQGDFTAEGGWRVDGWDGYVTAAQRHTDGHRPRSQADSYHASILLGRRLPAGWDLSVMARHADDRVWDPGTLAEVSARAAQGRPVDKWSRAMRTGADATARRSDGVWSTTLKAFMDYGKNVIQNRSVTTYLWDSLDRTFGAAAGVGYSQDGVSLDLGGDLKSAGGDGRDAATNRGFPGTRRSEGGVFAVAKAGVLHSLSASAGARIHGHDSYDPEFVPQAGLEYGLPLRMTLRGSVAKGFRSPTIAELFHAAGAASDLSPERAWNYEVGLSQGWGAKASWDIVAYIMEGRNLIRSEGTGAAARYRNSGSFTHRGLEGSFKLAALPSVDITGTMTVMDPHNETKGNPYAHGVLNVTRRWSRFLLSARAQGVHKLYGADYRGSRLPDCVLAGLRAELEPRAGVRFFAEGRNLLDKEYQFADGYPMPGPNATAGVEVRF